jgi:hypothetical protein
MSSSPESSTRRADRAALADTREVEALPDDPVELPPGARRFSLPRADPEECITLTRMRPIATPRVMSAVEMRTP